MAKAPDTIRDLEEIIIVDKDLKTIGVCRIEYSSAFDPSQYNFTKEY